MQTIDLGTDVALGVTIPARNARGRLARIGPVLDEVLANHNYPPVIEILLAEALVLTALLGSLLKDPTGQMTLQAQTENGIVDL
jgi:molecular chaperone Hsp33